MSLTFTGTFHIDEIRVNGKSGIRARFMDPDSDLFFEYRSVPSWSHNHDPSAREYAERATVTKLVHAIIEHVRENP